MQQSQGRYSQSQYNMELFKTKEVRFAWFPTTVRETKDLDSQYVVIWLEDYTAKTNFNQKYKLLK